MGTLHPIKFTEKGEVELHVRLLEQSNGIAQIQFAVRDMGIGLSPKDQMNLFQAFTQADGSTARKYGGDRPWPGYLQGTGPADGWAT